MDMWIYQRTGRQNIYWNAGRWNSHWADNLPVQIRIEDNAMYISNCSMLPFGWTVETLLSTHVSKPYNPDIARVFYCAGYIESWGRGIQKIRDACKNLGADDPEYIIHGEDIMVKFSASKSTKVSDSKALNVTKDVTKDVTIEIKILALLKENASVTTTEMVKQLSVNRLTIQKGLDVLKSNGVIERKGSKRYGYWIVYE